MDMQTNPLLSPDSGEVTGVSERILILGYGNIDRQDDGVAWHILRSVAECLGKPIQAGEENSLVETGAGIDFSFELQLMPEMAEIIAQYDRICFVDAHTGSVEDELHLEHLSPEYTNSPFTHHLTPATCLALADALYKKTPQAILVSIRGYEFGFDQGLSERTAQLAVSASEQILAWIHERQG